MKFNVQVQKVGEDGQPLADFLTCDGPPADAWLLIHMQRDAENRIGFTLFGSDGAAPEKPMGGDLVFQAFTHLAFQVARMKDLNKQVRALGVITFEMVRAAMLGKQVVSTEPNFKEMALKAMAASKGGIITSITNPKRLEDFLADGLKEAYRMGRSAAGNDFKEEVSDNGNQNPPQEG